MKGISIPLFFKCSSTQEEGHILEFRMVAASKAALYNHCHVCMVWTRSN